MTATTTAPVASPEIPGPVRRPSARLRAWATRAPLLPALIFMIVVTQLPFVATLVISFFDWNSLYPDARSFAGLANYGEVLTDPDLRRSVWTTVLLTVAVVLASESPAVRTHSTIRSATELDPRSARIVSSTSGA